MRSGKVLAGKCHSLRPARKTNAYGKKMAAVHFTTIAYEPKPICYKDRPIFCNILDLKILKLLYVFMSVKVIVRKELR